MITIAPSALTNYEAFAGFAADGVNRIGSSTRMIG